MQSQDPRYWSSTNGNCKGLEDGEHKFEELTVISSSSLQQKLCERVSLGDKVERESLKGWVCQAKES